MSKQLMEQNQCRNLEADANRRTVVQKDQLAAEDREEYSYLVNQVLVEDSHFNFPKIHGKHWVKIIRNLSGIADEFLVLEIEKHLHEVFEDNVCAMADYLQSDAEGILLGTEVQAYNAVEIPVLDQDVDDKNSYQLQHVHTVGGKSWRRKEARKDTISGILHHTVQKGCLTSRNLNVEEGR
ncbi:hypothetical protein BGX38DRAFT_1147747 [Terfezia claveryi]|nr:hypothetical protein BGX38DRAFT_1147747 [Terfezia claveryi]